MQLTHSMVLQWCFSRRRFCNWIITARQVNFNFIGCHYTAVLLPYTPLRRRRRAEAGDLFTAWHCREGCCGIVRLGAHVAPGRYPPVLLNVCVPFGNLRVATETSEVAVWCTHRTFCFELLFFGSEQMRSRTFAVGRYFRTFCGQVIPLLPYYWKTRPDYTLSCRQLSLNTSESK